MCPSGITSTQYPFTFKILASCKCVPSAEKESVSLFAITLIRESYPFALSFLPSVMLIPLSFATREALTALTGELKNGFTAP